jgi:hypothetical protein
MVTFDSLSTGITQAPIFYTHVGFPIYKYRIARGCDIIQKGTFHYLGFDKPYFPTQLRRVVGINECGLEMSYCLEKFKIWAFIALLLELRN